ncbi:MAG: hypothetical protein EZS28_044486, partial [Streblomastix strix]
RSWQKLREPIMRTFRLSHQTTVHAQAASEALVLNERGKFLKATTPPPGVIQQSVMKELNKRSSSAQTLFKGGGGKKLDPSVAQLKERKEQKRDEPLNCQIQEISEEIREADFDRNNACLEGRGLQTGTLATIKTNIAPRKHSLIYETSPRGDQSEGYNQVNPHHIKLYSPTFCIPKRDGSYRKILDARNLNAETKRIHFKIIFSQDVQFAIQQNNFLTSIDIKSTFNRITVHPSLQPYLGFQVANASYVYISMPFGLKLAPIVFSKTLQAAQAAAKEGFSSTILQYTDDVLLINKDKQILLIETVTVKQRFQNLGWVNNNAKSEMVPKQEISTQDGSGTRTPQSVLLAYVVIVAVIIDLVSNSNGLLARIIECHQNNSGRIVSFNWRVESQPRRRAARSLIRLSLIRWKDASWN